MIRRSGMSLALRRRINEFERIRARNDHLLFSEDPKLVSGNLKKYQANLGFDIQGELQKKGLQIQKAQFFFLTLAAEETWLQKKFHQFSINLPAQG